MKSGLRERSIGNPNSWWNKECNKVIKNRRMALSTFKKDECLNKWVEYKRCRAVTKKLSTRRELVSKFSARVLIDLLVCVMFGIK